MPTHGLAAADDGAAPAVAQVTVEEVVEVGGGPFSRLGERGPVHVVVDLKLRPQQLAEESSRIELVNQVWGVREMNQSATFPVNRPRHAQGAAQHRSRATAQRLA